MNAPAHWERSPVGTVRTTFHGAKQVPRLIERLSVKVTTSQGLVRSRPVTEGRFETAHSPAAWQEDEKLCHLHLGPYFVLVLRGTNFKYQILRDLHDTRYTHSSC